MNCLLRRFVFAFCVASLLAGSALGQARLSRLTLSNGLSFDGKFSSIDEIAKDLSVRNVTPGGVSVKNIVIVDDNLRRTFFPKRNLVSINDAEQDTVVRFRQRRPKMTRRVGNVGAILGADPFDDLGRRTISVMAQGGKQQIVQEIVEISPVYTRLQSKNVFWDMRIATSSIPSDQLRRIFMRRGTTQAEKSEARLDLVRILFLSERYKEAAGELELIIKEFPKLDQAQLKRQHDALIQQGAQLILREIELRRKAGQHVNVAYLLNGFENTGVAATENLIQAAEMLQEYEKVKAQGTQVLSLLQPLVESQKEDGPSPKMIRELFAEINTDLNINNLERMADFLRLAKGGKLTDEEKLAIGISGWLLGQGEVSQNLRVASSLLEVRNLVREYLRTMGSGEKEKAARQELIRKIKDREGGSPEYVAKLLKNMKPPMDFPETTSSVALQFDVEVPGTPDGFPVKYTVQLPPEYDPYSSYPTVLSLHGAGFSPKTQIEWWAGPYDEKRSRRNGQASRHGYIVIAPAWTKPKQKKYEYSAREHHIVLAALRDATRRFSINTDKVFLSGHALGGDAAWDIGVAHPDLWAGMVLIGARSEYGKGSPEYIKHYDENPKYFPMYFVFGENDNGKMNDNSTPLNRYMRPGYDPVIVQYRGRGNEHFFEEVHNIFDWMNLQQRELPTEFEINTMRPWDSFFWFTEFDDFQGKTMVTPFEWPKKNPKAAEISARILKSRIVIRSGGAERTTVWLSPEIVDFDKKMEISVNRKTINQDFEPNLEVMLEDARTRADRKHVFWTKIVDDRRREAR